MGAGHLGPGRAERGGSDGVRGLRHGRGARSGAPGCVCEGEQDHRARLREGRALSLWRCRGRIQGKRGLPGDVMALKGPEASTAASVERMCWENHSNGLGWKGYERSRAGTPSPAQVPHSPALHTARDGESADRVCDHERCPGEVRQPLVLSPLCSIPVSPKGSP